MAGAPNGTPTANGTAAQLPRAAEGAEASRQAEAPATSAPTPSRQLSRRLTRFETALHQESIDKKSLAELAWSGVPVGTSRCEVWQLLLDYRPLARDRRDQCLRRKRQEYDDLRRNLYEASSAVAQAAEGEASPTLSSGSGEGKLLKQIRKDLPRTQLRFSAEAGAEQPAASDIVTRSPQVRMLMERVLFIWAVRQPATGYVQGVDGVLLFLLVIFLADRSGCSPEELDANLLERLGDELFREVEADCYWCVSKILSMMLDHYVDGFPGIQRMATQLMDLVFRIDERLARHLEAQGIDIFEVALRWIGCLMVRELPVPSCARLWDALIAESAQGGLEGSGTAGFETLLMYFCLCFITRFSERLQAMDFEAITMFLKRTSAEAVGESDVELLLGEAFVLKSLFQNSPSHLSSRGTASPGMAR